MVLSLLMRMQEAGCVKLMETGLRHLEDRLDVLVNDAGGFDRNQEF